MEDYLEAIAKLKKEKRVARVRDIGRLLNVSNPSVNSALNVLSDLGLVVHERYGYVDLTIKGEELAGNVQKRHDIIVRFLTTVLNIDPRTAEGDACRMEHSISNETFEMLTKFMEFIETCPEKRRPEWLKNFDLYVKTGKRQKCAGGVRR
jgi:DtxR family Mn-dependent transcriptional regulator